MGLPGSRGKSTDVWLSAPDESAFGEQVAAELPSARWRCDNRRGFGHVHTTIGEAIECSPVQVYLSLPAGAHPLSSDAITTVQLVRSEIRERSAQASGSRMEALARELGGTYYPPATSGGSGRHFRKGWLATRWFEPEVGPEMHKVLLGQRALVWRALRRSTVPAHIEDPTGRAVSGKRIGPAALDMFRATDLPLADIGILRYRLRD